MQNIGLNEVFEKVRTVISASCGINPEKVSLKSTLFDDLEIDSIDFVDILFMLETSYSISLKVGDIERDARRELGEKPFAVNNMITPDGLELLKEKMPEVPSEKIKEGLAVHDIVSLISVHSLCKMIINKIALRQAGTGN
ncbi:MAG: phosphopantetheine-binding protein [Bacteroidetes bacterium]|nr:phosphopantetheine-binding protein [Bacteroidota bacterium]